MPCLLLRAMIFIFLLSSIARAEGSGMPRQLAAQEARILKRATSVPSKVSYPWKTDIVTTTFWIGQGRTIISETTNYKSAWDVEWTDNYGGMDDPIRRVGLLPRRFAPTLNPFYVALPFNDLAYPEIARKCVPWWKPEQAGEPTRSQCKGRWVQIRNKAGRSAYGQWEDVGPLRSDHASYVFGDERPQRHSKAGLDVSPALCDFLGLDGKSLTDWRFVEATDVPNGPWMKFSEQAILYSVLKRKETSAAKIQPRETALIRSFSRGRNG